MGLNHISVMCGWVTTVDGASRHLVGVRLFAGSSTGPDDCGGHVVGHVVLTDACDSQARAAVGRHGVLTRRGGGGRGDGGRWRWDVIIHIDFGYMLLYVVVQI